MTCWMACFGRLYPMDVWPSEGTVINCWTGGSMGPYLRQLPQYYGEPPIHDLGLLASEGRFTIPLSGGTASGVLDVWSHYFEFTPEGEINQKSFYVAQITMLRGETSDVFSGKFNYVKF